MSSPSLSASEDRAAKPAKQEVVTLQSYQIPTHWDDLEPLVEKALEHGTGKFAPEDIFRALLAREMQMWVCMRDGEIETCCITRIALYPRQKALEMFLVSGTKIDDWLPYQEVVGAWAKTMGCDVMFALGRSGWERKLKDWRKRAVILEREI